MVAAGSDLTVSEIWIKFYVDVIYKYDNESCQRFLVNFTFVKIYSQNI